MTAALSSARSRPGERAAYLLALFGGEERTTTAALERAELGAALLVEWMGTIERALTGEKG